MAKKIALQIKFVLFFLLIFTLQSFGAELKASTSSAEALFLEEFRIKIVNTREGSIEASFNKGISWEGLGKVLLPAKKINPKGFTASMWGKTSEVTATAVNAIHIRCEGEKSIFSIVPVEFIEGFKNYRSYTGGNSSIYTDIPGGKSLFGGGLAPYVGNNVLVNGKKAKNEINEGDIIEIFVERPIKYPKEIVFENIFGGKIIASFDNDEKVVVGEVLRPVYGVGRFEGSLFLNPGRIRANHTGVIDISTSPSNRVGGFQIIPAGHAQSKEMIYARLKTQWMIVSSTSIDGGSLEGLPPLFKYFLKPQYDFEDINTKEWKDKFSKRFLVEVFFANQKKWSSMPVFGLRRGEDLPEEANSFLKDVEKIKIIFPSVH